MKTHDVKIIADGSIIQITYFGDVTFTSANASREEASAIAFQHGIKSFLVDLNQAQVVASVLELYEFHSQNPQILPLATRIAIVHARNNWSEGLSQAQFSENLDINRGIARKAFKKRSDAVTWLLNDEN